MTTHHRATRPLANLALTVSLLGAFCGCASFKPQPSVKHGVVLTSRTEKIVGACGKFDIVRMLRQRRNHFWSCYHSAFGRSVGKPVGQITLKWLISPRGGRSKMVEVEDETFRPGSPRLHACLKHAIKGLGAVRVSGGGYCIVRWTLRFDRWAPKKPPASKKTAPKPR